MGNKTHLRTEPGIPPAIVEPVLVAPVWGFQVKPSLLPKETIFFQCRQCSLRLAQQSPRRLEDMLRELWLMIVPRPWPTGEIDVPST